MDDLYGLQRFVDAQQGVYEAACAELQIGRKQTHWMWFIFPQIRGLGRSPTAQRFAIASVEEAAAFLRHPVLGPRLRECTKLALAIDGHTIHEIFGSPDDLKFHSCMTLFAAVAPKETLFGAALQKFFAGTPDQATLDRL
jgi:uncharacterized protein (DUF1810 family)